MLYSVFLISMSFFMGQLSVFATAAIMRSLSSCSIPHSSSMCSAVGFPFPHWQSGAFMILNLCSYDFMFPWPVPRVVKCCVRFIFIFSHQEKFVT